ATPSFTPAGMVNGTAYYWSVVAKNTDGTTTGPTWSFTTVAGGPAMPSSPSPISGATGVSISASLTWTAAGATSYDVRFGTSNPPPVVATGLVSPSFTPAGLVNGTAYYW